MSTQKEILAGESKPTSAYDPLEEGKGEEKEVSGRFQLAYFFMYANFVKYVRNINH